jgi:hypothetical protein
MTVVFNVGHFMNKILTNFCCFLRLSLHYNLMHDLNFLRGTIRHNYFHSEYIECTTIILHDLSTTGMFYYVRLLYYKYTYLTVSD